MKMMLEFGTMLCALHLSLAIQMFHEDVVFNMMPNAFDDQYIGCVAKMKKEMKKILAEELRNNRQLAEMWEQASQVWKDKSSTIKKKIDDNFGTAVVLYTMEGAYSIYRQLNGNISIAGKSRDFYMKNFHFKALHFYLSRALQVLRTGSEKTQVYRGMNTGAVSVAKEMRFGRFTSSSLSESIAQGYGENPFFRILTRFGVDISKFSVFEEQEVLIPIGEKFKLVKQNGTTYELESTGKLCSYFNCAYLGGKKRTRPVCKSVRSRWIWGLDKFTPTLRILRDQLQANPWRASINFLCCQLPTGSTFRPGILYRP